MTMVTTSDPAPLRERKKQQTRERLIEVAVELFGQRGIGNTTVDDIAAHAGIGKGTVYNYFPSKEDLVVAFLAQLEAALQPVAERYSESLEPLPEILAGFVWSHLEPKRQYRPFVRAFLARMMTADEVFFEHIMAMQDAIDANLTTLFARLRQRGLTNPNWPLSDLLLNFKTMQLGITMLWALEGPPWTATRQVIQTQTGMFAEGIKAA